MAQESKKITFIDLFAGIGGFHLALHSLGASCVFASEIDNAARATYMHNFLKVSPALFSNNHFNDNILSVNPSDIPDFDILCAGFPCQPFSQAGYKRGFTERKDDRGNMFFRICDIIKAKRPRAIFLENVQHLLKHDEGKTFAIIKHAIEDDLGYDFYYKVVKASDYGLPQHRARIFMVGFDKTLKLPRNFMFPPKQPLKYTMSDIFGGKCTKDIGFTLRVGGRGSKFGDRRNWEFYSVDGQIKRLGVVEGKKMMGLPDAFHFPVSPVQAMKQLGNSVAVDAIHAVAQNIINFLQQTESHDDLVFDADNQLHFNYLSREPLYAHV